MARSATANATRPRSVKQHPIDDRRDVQPLLVVDDLAELMADEDRLGNAPDDRFAGRRDDALARFGDATLDRFDRPRE